MSKTYLLVICLLSTAFTGCVIENDADDEPTPKKTVDSWTLEEAETGEMYSLNQYYDNGNLIFIEFFHTDCSHCHEQTGPLKEIYEEYGKDNTINMFSIGGYSLGSNTDDKSDIASFKFEYSLYWPHLYDTSGELMRDYGFISYPSMVLIKDGEIVYSHSGQLSSDGLSEQINKHGSLSSPPIAKITPSNPKIQVNETVSFSGSDSTDSNNDNLTYLWLFQGDSKQYEGISIERNYTDKGEFLVKLVVTDSTGLSDETVTTVLVVEDYHEEQAGTVDEGENNTISIPVETVELLSLRIEYSLESNSIMPLEESQVTLRLTDADGVIIDEETGVEEGDGVWSYSNDDLSSTGDYTFTIESESGNMDYEVIIDVKY